MQVPFYALGFLALCLLIGAAAIIAVCRANRDDLPAIVLALMRTGMPDDSQKGSPSLPVNGNRKCPCGSDKRYLTCHDERG
jgi:hypothetical protein